MFWHLFSSKLNDVFCLKRRRFIHYFKKKKRSPNGVVLNGTVGLLLPLDARGRGKRIFSLAFLLSFFLRKLQKDVDTTPHLLKFWPVVYHVVKKHKGRTPWAVMGRLHSGCPDHPTLAPWLGRGSRPLPPCFFSYKYKGRESIKKRQLEKTKKKKKRKNRGEKRRSREQNRGGLPPAPPCHRPQPQ